MEFALKRPRGRPRSRPVHQPPSFGHGVTIRSQAREMVVNVRQFFEEEAKKISQEDVPLIPFNRVRERTSAALKISESTVWRVTKENINAAESGKTKLSTPGKKRPRKSPVTDMDSFLQNAVRQHIYLYYARKEYPTTKKLLVSLKKDNLFNGKYSSLLKVLHKLGFEHSKVNGRKVLLERGDIVAQRSAFLQNIKNVDFTKVVWVDETWVNARYSKSKSWTDETKEGTMGVPLGRGGRIILCHAGTSHGFVNGALLLFQSKKTGDYHEEMNANTYKSWFVEQLLPNIDDNSVIVMDNASYHSVQLDKAPTNAKKKSEIIEWLLSHGVEAHIGLTKGKLLELVATVKPARPVYEIDEIAKNKGHQIIRLPPYHCHFNPIELIWSHVKRYVGNNNKKFTISEVEKLTYESIGNVTTEDWRKSVQHVQNSIHDSIRKEGILDNNVDQLIISLKEASYSSSGSSDDSYSDDENDEMEGIHELREDEDQSNTTPSTNAVILPFTEH